MATVNEKMTAIADAIRDKTGGTEALTLDGIKENIPAVYDAGKEAGKKAQYDEFWDAYQLNGKRTNYYRAFMNGSTNDRGWNNVTFRPKYDLNPTSLAQAFMSIGVTDFETLLSECGVTLDTQNCTSFQQCFQGALLTVFPTLHFKKATDVSQMFSNCTSLVTIRKIIFESGTNASFASTFASCSKLKDIVAEGSIEPNISFAASPLTVASLKSIISCLKDYSGTDSEYAYTVTFKTSAFEALEAEGATAEYNGVACTWAELIDNKKWNLTLA